MQICTGLQRFWRVLQKQRQEQQHGGKLSSPSSSKGGLRSSSLSKIADLHLLSTILACFAEAEPGTTAGRETKQPQQQHRRPQEAKGQVQHNQAAVKHKLLDRLADEVSHHTLVLVPSLL